MTAASRGSTPRRGIPWRLLALVVPLLVVAMAGEALGHAANPDFVSEVRRVTPAVPGLEVRMLGGDDRLEVRDPGHHTVVVLGYDGEPYARLLPDGSAQLNVRSPAVYLNRDRFARAEIPAQADARAAPLWKPYTRTGRLEWHDHRAHWMGLGRPPEVTDTSARTKIFDFRVPILVDGRSGAIEGTLFWAGRSGAPPLLLAAAIVVVPIMLGIAVLLWLLRRPPRVPGASDDPTAS